MNGTAAVERPIWHARHRTIRVAGRERMLRLIAFDRGWLASVAMESGPTLGADRSPYLAVSRAVEPLGVGLAEAMTLVGRVTR